MEFYSDGPTDHPLPPGAVELTFSRAASLADGSVPQIRREVAVGLLKEIDSRYLLVSAKTKDRSYIAGTAFKAPRSLLSDFDALVAAGKSPERTFLDALRKLELGRTSLSRGRFESFDRGRVYNDVELLLRHGDLSGEGAWP